MTWKIRTYIAGPISKGDLRQNIDLARTASVRLIHAGFAPFTPQLSCYMGGDTPEVLAAGIQHHEWLGMDLPWVAVSDCVLRLPGESTGADMEVAEAERLDIPVYHDVDE